MENDKLESLLKSENDERSQFVCHKDAEIFSLRVEIQQIRASNELNETKLVELQKSNHDLLVELDRQNVTHKTVVDAKNKMIRLLEQQSEKFAQKYGSLEAQVASTSSVTPAEESSLADFGDFWPTNTSTAGLDGCSYSAGIAELPKQNKDNNERMWQVTQSPSDKDCELPLYSGNNENFLPECHLDKASQCNGKDNKRRTQVKKNGRRPSNSPIPDLALFPIQKDVLFATELPPMDGIAALAATLEAEPEAADNQSKLIWEPENCPRKHAKQLGPIVLVRQGIMDHYANRLVHIDDEAAQQHLADCVCVKYHVRGDEKAVPANAVTLFEDSVYCKPTTNGRVLRTRLPKSEPKTQVVQPLVTRKKRKPSSKKVQADSNVKPAKATRALKVKMPLQQRTSTQGPGAKPANKDKQRKAARKRLPGTQPC